jgi:hypothetical protein
MSKYMKRANLHFTALQWLNVNHGGSIGSMNPAWSNWDILCDFRKEKE